MLVICGRAMHALSPSLLFDTRGKEVEAQGDGPHELTHQRTATAAIYRCEGQPVAFHPCGLREQLPWTWQVGHFMYIVGAVTCQLRILFMSLERLSGSTHV